MSPIRYFSNLRIAAKLGLGFGLLILALAVIAGFSVRTTGQLGDAIADFAHQVNISVRIGEIQRSHQSVQAALRVLTTNDTPEGRREVSEHYAAFKDGVTNRIAMARKESSRIEWSGILADIDARYAPIVSGPESVPARQTQVAEARKVLTPVGTALAKTLTEMIGRYGQSADGIALVTLQDRFLRARISMRGFQYTALPTDLAEAKSLLQDGGAQIERLGSNPEIAADPQYADLKRGVAAYVAGTEAMGTAIGERERTRTTLSALDAELGKRIEAARQKTTTQMTAMQAFAKSESESNRSFAMVAASIAIVVGVVLASLIARGIARPITAMTVAMRSLATGDDAVTVPGIGRRDEVGAMAGAVEIFKDSLVRSRSLEAEVVLARADAETQRRASMNKLADGFEQAVGTVIAQLATAAGELQITATGMSDTASETARQSITVAAAAEEAAVNVNTVSVAAEELGASVQEIGRQVNGSADLARVADQESAATERLVNDLSEAAARISDVVAMIAGIAGQTNLLALNATIEAARAGEAGRGFAVVAAEVKELATQTARATDEISGQISRIQASTGQAVQAINGIGGRIREIRSVATSIAAAVEQQGAATQEIVRNVLEAATGTGQVTSNIVGVAGAAEKTGTSAAQVSISAADLARQSDFLSQQVTNLLAGIRAA